jgi:hypothetical protein
MLALFGSVALRSVVASLVDFLDFHATSERSLAGPIVSKIYVSTQSLYAAVYDVASPVNTRGFLEHELEASKRRARARGADDCLGLFDFNQTLMNRAARGELLAWTLLFDGVFQASVEIRPPRDLDDTDATLIHNLGAETLVADLACPTGRLVIGCLSRLGEPQPLLAVVQPGTHRVHFAANLDEEWKHYLFDEHAAYPEGDGPDWMLSIRQIAP